MQWYRQPLDTRKLNRLSLRIQFLVVEDTSARKPQRVNIIQDGPERILDDDPVPLNPEIADVSYVFIVFELVAEFRLAFLYAC